MSVSVPMEPDIVPSLEEKDYNSQEIANVAFEELKSEENAKSNKEEKITCKHLNICEDVCVDCGVCLYYRNVCFEGEWNNYKDDCGNYSKNTQRCDTYVDSNPYSRVELFYLVVKIH